jgi:hypothetical protein
MPVREIRERLDRLQDHGFITGWKQEGTHWIVDYPGAYRAYNRSQIGAFIDGCNAMGAAP